LVFWLLAQWSAAAAISGLLGFTLANLRVPFTAGEN